MLSLDSLAFSESEAGQGLGGQCDHTIAVLGVPVHDQLEVSRHSLWLAQLTDLLGGALDKSTEHVVKLVATDHTHALQAGAEVEATDQSISKEALSVVVNSF